MPVTNNQTLGRGRLYFDKFTTGTQVGTGERYFGNTTEVSLTSESSNLDHYSADAGVKVKDKSVQLELNRSATFITDNISPENLALFFLGAESSVTQTLLTTQTETFTAVKKGYFYQIGKTTNRPQGLGGLTNVVVSGPSGTPVYTAGTDYVINLDTGHLEILEAGTIANAANVEVDYDIRAATFSRIITASEGTIEGALRYISDNPEGDNFSFFWPDVKITPNGDFALKGDDWQTIPFNVEILKKNDATEACYITGRPVYS